MEQINDSNTEQITYKAFVELFDKKIYVDVSTQEAVDAFALFDKEKSGKISIEDFKHVMNNLCEDLDKQQIQDFLELANS